MRQASVSYTHLDVYKRQALSGKPVMEGKGLLFKIYAGIDVFYIEVDEKDPEKFIAAVKAIAPTFGGINLPLCVYVTIIRL